MLQNAYLIAKIGADTAENERNFAGILPIGRCKPDASGPRDGLELHRVDHATNAKHDIAPEVPSRAGGGSAERRCVRQEADQPASLGHLRNW